MMKFLIFDTGGVALNLSMTPGRVLPVVHVSQYDTMRRIDVTLDDTVNASVVRVKGTRPDGGTVTSNEIAFTRNYDRFVWRPSADFTAKAGDVICEAVFENTNTLYPTGRVGSCNFILRVEPAGADEDAPVVHSAVTITEAGTYNVAPYDEAVVDIRRGGSGVKAVSENGVYNVEEYAKVNVSVPEPSGTKSITENGTYDVSAYESAVVNVPQGGDEPTGTVIINENGISDVGIYKYANVNVPGIIPAGTITISENGTGIDVSQYRLANVNVSGGGGSGVDLGDLLEGTKAAGSVELDISDTRLSTLKAYAFFSDAALGEVTVNAGVIGEGAFRGCNNLTAATVKGCTSVSAHAFEDCVNLAELHFTDISAVPTLVDVDAIDNTKIASDLGVIYFPAALVSAAKSASNWYLYGSMIQAEP